MSQGPDDAATDFRGGVNAPACLEECDLTTCQAQCCYDGVYLREDEEQELQAIVASAPGHFNLPGEWIVDGYWNGAFEGRKTATRAHEFTTRDVPAHLNATRCVFCDNEHKCSLQTLAVERGLHKWAYKPRSCWLFPLTESAGELHGPPGPTEPDPNHLGPDYPGYVKFVGCGRHRDRGRVWTETLAEEIDHWRELQPRDEASDD